ncbi:MAG: O-antigen ligase family protein [Anaerolineae bacterium]
MKTQLFRCALAGFLIVVSVLGVIQMEAQRRFLTQGRTTEFPRPVADTAFSPLCVNAALEQYPDEVLDETLEAITAGGFVWVRQRFPWAEIEPTPGAFDWERWDRILAGAVEAGVQIVAVLDSPPAWAGTPPDPEAFARFAGALANHYMAQLVYYQIWHNPNLGDAWGGEPDAYGYAELLAHGAEAIRAADPDARIVLGALAPNVESGPHNYAEDIFLKQLYVAGAAPYFDVVAVQPYGFHTGPEDRRVARTVLNFSRLLLVREVMTAYGEADKAVWATAFGWNSLPQDWEDVPSIWGSVDEATQAAYTVAALERAEDEWPWMGVMCLSSFQPRPATPRAVPDAEEHWGFALVGPEGEPRPVYEAVQAWAARPQVARPGVYPAGTALADFEGSWRLGPLGADIGRFGDSRVSLTFEGTGVALTVRRGPYRAFLFVTVDGEPAPALPRDEAGRAYIVLYDPLADVATVPLAENLAPGVHTVEVTADRGWYQWSLVDWRVVERPDHRYLRLGVTFFSGLAAVGVILGVLTVRRIDLRALLKALRGRWANLSRPLQAIGAAFLAAVFGLAAWMTWAQGSFRRLGEGVGLSAILLAGSMFYFSPWLLLALCSGAVLFLLLVLRPEVGLALVVATSPLYLHPVSLFGKSFALAELLLLPMLVGWTVALVTSGVSGKERSVWCRLRANFDDLVPLFAFVLIAVISTLLARHRHEALRELRLVIVEPVLFYLVAVTLPLRERDRWRVLDFYVASAVAVAVIGLVQYFLLGDVITAEGGILRLRSLYGSPNNVGLYLGRAWPLLLAVGLTAIKVEEERSLRLRWSRRSLTYGLALVPVGLALVLSLSRGAILLGIPVGLITLGLLAGRRERTVTLVVLVLFGLALLPLFQTPRFAALLDLTQGTTALRLALWRSAWQMFLDHPLWGVGPDNFLYAYRTRYVLPSAWEEFNLAHPHNLILDFLSRLGIFALGAFLWVLVRFWRRGLRLMRQATGQQRAVALGLLGSMASGLAHGLVDASYFYVDLAYVFFLTLAALQWLHRREGLSSDEG